MKKILVVGHKNPDTDSIVSSLIAAEYLKSVHKLDAKAFRAGEINNETKFVLKTIGASAPAMFRKPKKDEVFALVDHNEKSQIADGLEFEKVERIIDHHKFDVKTDGPIAIRVEPTGSTSSVLAMMYKEAGRKIPAPVAKLMLAGILSDTLNLASPTTTEFDKKLVRELNKDAKLDLGNFVRDMFAAKSSLKGISTEKIVNADSKLYEMGGKKVDLAVWETTDPDSVRTQKKKIMEYLLERKKKNKLDFMMFFVVDIVKKNSIMFVLEEQEKALAERIFKTKADGDEMFLAGIVSRKKQIAPPMMESLSK